MLKTSGLILSLTILVSLYWFLGLVVNVYRYAPVGAIYEIIWLPMIIGLFVLPVFSLILWYKSRFNYRSIYFYSLLISVISILILFIFFP